MSEEGKPRQKRLVDFDVNLKRLGSGAFGQVNLVRDKETGKFYAMKILSKAHIVKEKKLDYVKVERDAMSKLHHPNIVRLLLTFQDRANLYYVVEYASHGDLQSVLNDKWAIDIHQTKIILGQVLLAMAHMHQRRILHRDLKPENILLDDQNRVKITDFGTAKMFGKDEPFHCERGSFVGSADYVSPEVLKETELGPGSDLWSFGCIIYAMLVGYAPFHTDSNYATFKKIEECEYTIPDFVPDDARDLISSILKLNPADRFGNDTYDSAYEPIRNHKFFEGIEWETLPKKGIEEFTSYAPAVEAHERQKAEETEVILEEGESIIREGMISLKEETGELVDMIMMLTDNRRLLLSDLAKWKLHGEIALNSSVTATKLDKVTIRLEEDDMYDFIVDETETDAWISAISEYI